MTTSSVVWIERQTIGEFVIRILETRFPEWRNNSDQPIVGIIALGGTFAGQKLPGGRVQAAIELARCFPNAKVIFPEGNGLQVQQVTM